MRLRLLAFASALTIAVLLPVGADGAPQIVANFELDPPPSWQNAEQRLERGAWVKHSSPAVADLGDGPVILVGSQNGKLYALKNRNGSLTKCGIRQRDRHLHRLLARRRRPQRRRLPGSRRRCGDENRPKIGVHVFDCTVAITVSGPGRLVTYESRRRLCTPAIGDVTGDG